MELRQLTMFLSIVRHGTFSKAAQHLFLSQPTLSVQISALEQELGVKLFERQGKNITLTPAGEILQRYATDIASLHDRAVQEISQYKNTIAGSITLYSSTIPADYILPGLIAKFIRCHPDVYIELRRADSGAVWDRVLAYEVDFGIVGALKNHHSVDSIPFRTDELVVIAPPVEPYNNWPALIPASTLIAQPLVLRELGSGSPKTLDDAFIKKGIPLDKLNIKTRLESIEAVKTAVRNRLGVAVVSQLAVKQEAAAKELLVFTVSDLDLRRKFYLIKQQRKVLPPAAEALFNFIGASK